jgi:hypothetical protein
VMLLGELVLLLAEVAKLGFAASRSSEVCITLGGGSLAG